MLYYFTMTKNDIYRDYNVFCLANTDRENDSQYVARRTLDDHSTSGELISGKASDLAKCLVDYHTQYLAEHPAIKQSKDLTPFDCFDFNINYKAPYDIRLMDRKVYKAQELSSAEKTEFLESLKTRYFEHWDSD